MDMFAELEEPLDISQEQIDFYKKNNFIKLKNVLSPEVLSHFNTVISDKVGLLNKNITPLENRDTYGKAFIQLMNLWREDIEIRKLVFSKRIAKIATDLMQTKGVRLYHDQALFKEANGGITPWHADQYYWPLSSDKTITAWIPFQEIPLEMGPLEFSAESQKIEFGRALAISDESEMEMEKKLRVNDFRHVIEPFDVGEISFHSGWVFHRAGANQTSETRKVMTIIYMDKDMKLIEPKNENQKNDRDTWCPGVAVGQVIDSPINPVLFSY